MEPDTHEFSRRRSRLLQVNYGTSRPCKSFSVTDSGALIFCAAPFHRPTRPRAMTSRLFHMKYRDLAFQEFSPPLISKILDARNRENGPSGSTVGFSLNLKARINCSNNLNRSLLDSAFPFFMALLPYDHGLLTMGPNFPRRFGTSLIGSFHTLVFRFPDPRNRRSGAMCSTSLNEPDLFHNLATHDNCLWLTSKPPKPDSANRLINCHLSPLDQTTPTNLGFQDFDISTIDTLGLDISGL
jgi:hypothetical protein